MLGSFKRDVHVKRDDPGVVPFLDTASERRGITPLCQGFQD
jgi:hypothetical protein